MATLAETGGWEEKVVLAALPNKKKENKPSMEMEMESHGSVSITKRQSQHNTTNQSLWHVPDRRNNAHLVLHPIVDLDWTSGRWSQKCAKTMYEFHQSSAHRRIRSDEKIKNHMWFVCVCRSCVSLVCMCVLGVCVVWWVVWWWRGGGVVVAWWCVVVSGGVWWCVVVVCVVVVCVVQMIKSTASLSWRVSRCT